MCFHISIEEEEALFLTHYLSMMMHWLCVFSSLIADLASPNGIYVKKKHMNMNSEHLPYSINDRDKRSFVFFFIRARMCPMEIFFLFFSTVGGFVCLGVFFTSKIWWKKFGVRRRCKMIFRLYTRIRGGLFLLVLLMIALQTLSLYTYRHHSEMMRPVCTW